MLLMGPCSEHPKARRRERGVTCHLLSFQVFLKAGVVSRLERQREKLASHRILLFQAACKGFLSRQEFKKLKVWWLACLVIPAEV